MHAEAPEELDKMHKIWKEDPVVMLSKDNPKAPNGVYVKFPGSKPPIGWVWGNRRNWPRYNVIFKCWVVPMSWFDDMVEKMLIHFGHVYVIETVQSQHVCAPACWNAIGIACKCSCNGLNHGKNQPAGDWRVVSEAFAVYKGESKLTCRLIKAQDHLLLKRTDEGADPPKMLPHPRIPGDGSLVKSSEGTSCR